MRFFLFELLDVFFKIQNTLLYLTPLGVGIYVLKSSLFVWLCKEGNKNLLANNEVPILSFLTRRFFVVINGLVFH